MNLWRSLYACLLICSCYSTANIPSEIVINETNTNYVQKDYKSILVCANGAQNARLVVDNLYPLLKQNLAGESVRTSYLFFDDKPGSRREELATLKDLQNFDACLYIYQHDQPYLPAGTKKVNGSKEFNEIVGMRILDNSNLNNDIWSADVKLQFALLSDQLYSRLSTMLCQRLRTNKIIR